MAHRVARLQVRKTEKGKLIYVQGLNPRGQYYIWEKLHLAPGPLSKSERDLALTAEIERVLKKQSPVS